VNNGSEKERGLKHCFRNASVQSAERDTAMRSLTASQEYPVKLHDRLRIANRQAIEGRHRAMVRASRESCSAKMDDGTAVSATAIHRK
jgi:hypothetical protein